MGRKFKIAFSSTDDDTAYAYIHDLGFIPKIVDGKRGFRVVIAGGLGATPTLALPAYEFLPEDQVIPFSEAVIRVFDRYGERTRRMKARLKFLMNDIGLERFMELVEEERKAVQHKSYVINTNILPEPVLPTATTYPSITIDDANRYDRWFKTNVIKQKQEGFYGVYVRVELGNLSSDKSRLFADVVDQYAATEMRVTVNQGYLLRYVRPEALPHLYKALEALALAEPGFDSVGDITACPGTDSCALGISSSYGVAVALEKVIKEEYADLIYNSDIKIKISGCPNSCGQHGIASIGLHGSTIKDKNGKVMPALVVLLGGGTLKNGEGIISDKIIKLPSKRGPAMLRALLDDYAANSTEGEYYHDYFIRMGRNHFYTFLKPIGDLTTLLPEDYIDWSEDHDFVLHTSVGECAGVIIDLITTLLYDSEEKLALSKEAFDQDHFADSIYHSYSAFINTAKAMLLTVDVKPSTQYQVITDFQARFIDTGLIHLPTSFKEHLFRINKNEPSKSFAVEFMNDSENFLQNIKQYRESSLKELVTVEK